MSYKDLYSTKSELTTSTEGRRILLFGVPYDGTSSFRPGCRFGPSAFRQTYWNIELYDPVLEVDADDVALEDAGDLKAGTAEDVVNAVKRVAEETMRDGNVPAFIGGEHTLTYGSGLALPDDVTLLIFDAHLDFRDELYGVKLSHGTFLRRLLEDRELKVVHVGARAASKREWVDAGKLVKLLPGHGEWQSGLKEELKGIDKVYVSVDLDVLDPAYAPGVGNPEAGGITSRELLRSLYLLKGKEIVGFDVVELSPPYDTGATACMACKVFSILAILSGVGHAKQG